MGEITEVDVRQLRTDADRVHDAAERIAQMRWPTLNPDELAGSAVETAVVPEPMASRLSDVAATLRRWARTAQTSADAFDSAERRNGDRFGW